MSVVAPTRPEISTRETLDRLRAELLAARNEAGHWRGRLASSALSTATAISAYSALLRRDPTWMNDDDRAKATQQTLAAIQRLHSMQNDDGGFGDTDRSLSNIATSYLVLAAFTLAADVIDARVDQRVFRRLRDYIDRTGRHDALRDRYGKDKTFVVPILTNLAIAGLAEWNETATLPFEMAAVPGKFYRFVRMPVVSYAVPALVAIGVAWHHRRPTHFWPLRKLRDSVRSRSLKVLEKMQPDSGGYLEATPLTSFVLMSLAEADLADLPVCERGFKFLENSFREDSLWPIDTDLATWVTSLSIEALAADPNDDGAWATEGLAHWHLECQHKQRHPFTGADPGGWGWTDLSGAVPDGDDTPAAILAQTFLQSHGFISDACRDRSNRSIEKGRQWLGRLQNRDGGYPTFCRGWGRLPFDRSSTDLTAHALRCGSSGDQTKAVRFLLKKQNEDGSWSPLWFGNQWHAAEDNPIYGTSRVLMAAAFLPEPCVTRGVEFLMANQHADGSFGGACGGSGGSESFGLSGSPSGPDRSEVENAGSKMLGSVEETSLALEALAFVAHRRTTDPSLGSSERLSGIHSAILRATDALAASVDRGEHRIASPIGFYFAKLWYYEDLYPTLFAMRALGAVMRFRSDTARP